MKKYVMLLSLFVLEISIAQPNSYENVSNILPPTPESSSLIEGYKAKLNGFRGGLDYSIPIWEIDKELGFSILLSYHSNSNKVKSRASRVGLGWNLFAGGIVTRTIRDYPDDVANGFLQFPRYNEKFEEDENIRKHFATLYRFNPNDVKFDTEPDIYNFNFLNFSGTFIISNSTFTPLVQSNEDKKVEIEFFNNSKKIRKFIFTDLKGNKYYFGETQDGSIAAYERNTSSRINQINTSGGVLNSIGSDDLSKNAIIGWGLLEIVMNNLHIRFQS